MRIFAKLSVAIVVGAWATATLAEEKKTERECDSIVTKHAIALADLLREPKPKGNCAIARWSIERHEEKLRIFGAEPDECKKTDLGKKFVSTVKSVIGQEQRTLKRSCKRR